MTQKRDKAAILHALWFNQSLTRQQIAERLSVSRSSAYRFIHELQEQGWLVPAEKAPSARKAKLLRPNPQKGLVIGLSFTTRGICSALGKPDGQLLNLSCWDFYPRFPVNRTLELLSQAVQSQVDFARVNSPRTSLWQLAIAISGMVDETLGVSLNFPRYPEWKEVGLKERFERQFSLPTVVSNHIIATTLAEKVYGKGNGAHNILYVHLGTGLGTGYIVNDQLYRGARFNAGELGHISVVGEENSPCYCGKYGCLETVASDFALVEQATRALHSGVRSRLNELIGGAPLSAGAIFQAAAQGDLFSLNLIERAARHLGSTIANMVNLFSPEMLILGGSMVQANDLLYQRIIHYLRTLTWSRLMNTLKVEKSSFSSNPQILGAVALAFDAYFAGLEHN